MCQGGRRSPNRNAHAILDRIIGTCPEGTIFHSEYLALSINKTNKCRGYTAGRVGCLMRARDDVAKVTDGIWERI
jgi:nitrate reductase beta subunit